VAIGNSELEAFIFIGVALGFAGLCWAMAGLQGIYDGIGTGYLDVSDSDPVEQSGPEPAVDELADARQLWAATAALREARGEAVPSADERLAALERELKGAA
jgi:hypothetical protein